ncbi:unnamed protein product [Boreogadus saida]
MLIIKKSPGQRSAASGGSRRGIPLAYRSLQGRRVPTCSSKQVLHRREQGALGNPPGSRWGAKALALHIVRYGGERRGRHGNPFDGRRLTHDLVLYDGGGCNPRAGKTGRRVAVHGGVVVGVDDAIVVRSTAGEKKRCLERTPSSGSSRQATQETGAAIAAAAWSEPRHTKHAKCPSPGAREAGQEAHRSPEKDLAPGALSESLVSSHPLLRYGLPLSALQQATQC